MDTILQIADKARLRLQLDSTLRQSMQWLLYLSTVILLLAIVDRVGVVPIIPWKVVWIISAFATATIFVTQWYARRVSSLQAASELDERLHLHDRVSSALSSGAACNPFSDAVLADALDIIEKEKVKENLPKNFPIEFPKLFWWVFVTALASFCVLWSPQWGFFNGDDEEILPASVVASRENVESSVESVLEQLKSDEQLSQELEKELDELAFATENNLANPTKMRRDALKKMTDLQKRLDELLQDENSLAFEEMLKRMQGLKLPKTGSTLPLVAAMKNGDMNKAKKEFDKLQGQMDSEDLSDEEREELQKQLEELSEQFEELAKANDSLASALSAAGLNGALAKNSEAAKKAIQNAKNLTEEQKKKLLELLKTQQKASNQCKKIGEGCKSCANGKGGSSAANELEKMKALKEFQTKAQMAKNACKNATSCMGSTGGEKNGNGGLNPTEETKTTMVAERTPVSTLEGTIIAKQLFEGGLLTSGESTSAVKQTVLTQKREAEQAIAEEEVPRKYHDLLRHYFGELEELTEPSEHDDTKNSE
jgi:hypothetical protein